MAFNARATFEAIVQPAVDVATAAAGNGGAVVNTIVSEFEEQVGRTLDELGIDLPSLEALPPQARGALAALLNAKQTIIDRKGALESAIGDVQAVAHLPLNVWRGENVALVQTLFQEEARAREAAWKVLGLLADFLGAVDAADQGALRDALIALDPRLGDWLNRA
jgi:hypothetical protein